MYFCDKNKKLNSKNLPTNPANGGIPDMDKRVKTTVIEIKLCLLKIFKLLSVFIFFKSYKNKTVKKRYNTYMYMYTFICIIDTPQ